MEISDVPEDMQFAVQVVCSGSKHRRDRLLYQLTWERNEQWLLDSVEARETSSEAAEIILRNERFGSWSHRTNRSGQSVERSPDAFVEYLASEGVADRAGALGGWRFKCTCGLDRPVKQVSMERWILDQIEQHPGVGKFHFDIAS